MITQRCVGISYTLQCPLACDHCVTFSSPQTKERMTLEEAMGYIDELEGLVEHICFTGGEVFLHLPELIKLVDKATRQGHLVSAMTSAYWATSDGITKKKIQSLMDVGLVELGISLDRYHLDFIPEERALRAARMADSLGLEAAIRVVVGKDDDYDDYIKSLFVNSSVRVESCPVVNLGRASSKITRNEFFSLGLKQMHRCETVRSADVLPNGKVTACCGPGMYMTDQNPLVLGNAKQEPLSEIIQRSWNNNIMKLINVSGPAGLQQQLDAENLTTTLPQNYTDICALCLAITNNPDSTTALEKKLNSETTITRLDAAVLLQEVHDINNSPFALPCCEKKPAETNQVKHQN